MTSILHLLIVCVLAAAPAREFLKDPVAIAHFERAQRSFENRDYTGAAAALEATYAVEPATQLLYPWAQAARLGGDSERAVRLYRQFLSESPPATHAKLAHENILACEELRARAQEGPAVASPTEALPVDATAGPPGARPWQRDVAGAALVGTGVVGLVVGTGILIGALSAASSTSEAVDVGDYEDRMGRATTLRNVAIGAFAVGGALAIAGIIRYAVVARRSRTRVGLWLDRGGAGVSVTLPLLLGR